MPVQATQHGWVLETRTTAYAFGLNSEGLLVHGYHGQRLPRIEDYPVPANADGWASFSGSAHLLPEEYPGYGGTKYIEPCLKVTFADGVRDVVLRFQEAIIEENHLIIYLQDAHYPLQVALHYNTHPDYDLIERRVAVTNNGDSPMILERIWSAQWHLPVGDGYRLTHLSGRWLDEMHLRRETLLPGVKVLESRRLTTSHHHNPWFAVDTGTADETHGEVWFGVLAWSGNWKLAAEVTDFQSTRINIGLNDWDFAWQLEPGETFTTPASYGGWTSNGFGAASRMLHDFIRDTVIPHGKTIHKILYNSWEATFFDVDEPSQIQLAEIAAAMGIELFVMDDGWFYGRNDDHAGLGDWWPDPAKFPHGLNPLIERVNALGMEFGLWIEPEMVNPNSDLYRAHPDWTIHFPHRARTESRNQLILNFAREDVQTYIFEQIDRLLTDHKIAFIKWDMNRNVSEPGWPEMGSKQRELWVRYVYGLYQVWGMLRERHPEVIWQSCSGGGGRADLAILQLADQIWVSDNTEAPARLNIQEGFSQIFPANTMEAWVTDSGEKHIPLTFKFHVSMCGSLGVGGHLLHWSEEDRQEAARQIALYKKIQHVIQFGDLYRLRSPQEHPYSAVQYMSKDKTEGVLFVFRTHEANPAPTPVIRLQGLEPDALYRIENVDFTHSGTGWMQIGVQLPLKDYESRVCRITRL